MKQIVRGALLLAGLVLGSAVQAGKVTYIYTDAQGTPVMESDAQGHITARYDYTPYGVPAQGLSGSPNGPGYTGHVNDPDTGFVYMQARYYDPVAGRFISVDPITPFAGNIDSFARFTYVKGNPVKNIDPDGRQSYPGNLDYPGAPSSNAQATAMTGASALQGVSDTLNWIDVNVQTPLAGSGVEEQFTPSISAGLHGSEEAFASAAILVKTSVKAGDLRRIGTSVFKDSKLFKIAVSGGKCEYCGAAAQVGDHAKSLSSFAKDVNAGRLTKAEAVEMAHSPDNIKGACVLCNGDKGAQDLSKTPGDGGYVPTNQKADE